MRVVIDRAAFLEGLRHLDVPENVVAGVERAMPTGPITVDNWTGQYGDITFSAPGSGGMAILRSDPYFDAFFNVVTIFVNRAGLTPSTVAPTWVPYAVGGGILAAVGIGLWVVFRK